MIQVVCEECGKIVFRSPAEFRRRKQHFCSRKCHMVYMNRVMNPERMTPEVREKLRNSKLGTGEGKTYTKTYGRHTHRIVAEEKLGRPLKKGEIVHHIDGNKRNNDPSNLMVMTQSEHCRIHFKKGGDLKHVDGIISSSEGSVEAN